MVDLIFLTALGALFIVEFVLNLLAHAMALRLAMCHTLVLLAFNVAQVLERRRVKQLTLRKLKVDVDAFVTFLYSVAYVMVFGFVVVNILHSLQLLVHRHDMDVHHSLVVLLVGSADFLLKLFLWPFLDCGYYQKSKCGKILKTLFYLTTSILLLLIASLRCISKSYLWLILWLDPSLTIVACLVVFVAAFQPAKDFLFTLLLASPRNLNVGEISHSFRREFPEVDINELRVWRESRNRVAAAIHIRLQCKRYSDLVQKIHEFFHNLGVNRVVLQPDFEK